MRAIIAGILIAASMAFAGGAPRTSTEELRQLRRLCYTLGNDDLNTRWAAAFKLIEAGPKAIGPVSEILDGDWIEGRRMATYILGEMKHPATIGPLANAMNDKDFDVRWKAAVALKATGRSSTQAAIGILGGGTLDGRRCAAWLLGELKDPAAAPALCRTLGDPDFELAAKARVSLSTIGDAAVVSLAEQLKSKKHLVRFWAAEVLGELGSPTALGPLSSVADDPDAGIRRITAKSLGMIGEPKAKAVLEGFLDDDEPAVRREAIIALARYGVAARTGKTNRPELGDAIPKVGQWLAFEVELGPDDIPAGEDVTVKGEFVAPSKSIARVPGFNAGDGRWIVRFAPSEPGEWPYTVTVIAGEKVNTLHGILDCVGSDRLGPPAADPERPGSFARAVPVEVGTTGLWCLGPDGSPRNTPDAWRKLFAALGRTRVDKLRLKLIEPCDIAAVKARPELSPWPLRPDGTFDLDRVEPRFWDALDAVLDLAQEARVTVELVAFDEDDLRQPNWRRHPFNAANGGPIKADEGTPLFYDPTIEANGRAQTIYLTQLAARACGRGNVTVELCSRMNHDRAAVPFGRRWAKQSAKLLHQNAPPWLMIALAPASGAAPYFRLAGIDIANLAPDDADAKVDRPCAQITPPGDAASIRRAAWSNAVRGRGVSFRPELATADELRVRSEQLAPLAAFIRQLPDAPFKHDDSIVLSAPNGIIPRAARSKDHIWVFLSGESKGAGALDIGARPGGYEARWFATTDGIFAAPEVGTQKGGIIHLKCRQFAHDAALLITILPPAEQ